MTILGVPVERFQDEDGRMDATVFRDDLRRLWERRPGWMELVCAASWTLALILLVQRDGGRWLTDQRLILVVGGVAAVTAQHALATPRRSFPLLVNWVSYGSLLALLFSGLRAGWVAPMVSLGVAVAMGIGAVHLWRQPWGPRYVGTVVVVASLLAWYGGFLSWWGGAMGRERWLALSFENQSGPLMAAVGCVGLGLALGQRRFVGGFGFALAAAGFAGAWLSGSRGTVVLLVPVLILVLVIAARQEGARTSLVRFAAVVVATVAAVAALTWTPSTPPGEGRLEQLVVNPSTEVTNLQARFGYWPPTVDMFAEAPLAGTGPGSYRWASRPYYRDDIELTTSAHNVYLEALSERGILGGLPIWVGAFAIGWLALRAVRRSGRDELPRIHRATRLSAVGAVAILGSHAGMDFDWDYPLLFVALTVGAAVLLVEVGRYGSDTPLQPEPDVAADGSLKRSRTSYLADVATLGVVSLLVVGFAGVSEEVEPPAAPWDLEVALNGVVASVADDDVEEARRLLGLVQRWNPGAWSLPPLTAYVDHAEGLIDDGELASSVGPRSASVQDQLLVAGRLVDEGAPGAADDILTDVRPVLDDRREWFNTPNLAAQVTLRSLEAAAVGSGCSNVEDTWEQERGWLESFDIEVAVVAHAWNERDGQDCPVPD